MTTPKESSEQQIQSSLPCLDCEGQLILQKNSNDGDANEKNHQLFSCNSCELRLEIQMEDDLSKNGTEKRFQCDICNRFYATPVTLKVHRLLHTTGKTELCDVCGARFKTRGQLKIHRRVHSGEKPYKCNECDKSFPYRESLITHSTVHTRIKPFLCVVCNARFSCIGNLLKHRKVRPTKCGLDSIPIRHIGPRPNKKTMPSLTDRHDKETQPKRRPKVTSPHKTTDPVDEIESDCVIEVFQDEAFSSSEQDDETSNFPTHASPEQIFAKEEEFLEGDENISYDHLYVDKESITEKEHNIIETSEGKTNIAHDSNNSAQEGENSVHTVSDNDEKGKWEYVHVEPDQSSDLSTGAKSHKNSNKRQRKQQSFESLEQLLDMANEESFRQEQQQLKLLHDLSEPIGTVDELYRCKLCPQQYTTQYLMARHLERLHSVPLDRARHKLQYVKNTTKSERRYRCKYCDQTYVNRTCLGKHILKHGPEGCLICKCACCDVYFGTQEETRQHELEQHRDRLECKVCQKLFKKPDQVLRHTRYAHGSAAKDRNQYLCSQCSKNFPSRIALSDHERGGCGKSPIYPCDKCDKRYSSYNSLKMHRTLHENQLPFVCSFCGKKFRTKGQQKVHERSHTGEKPFQCDKCTRAYSYRESLVVHLSTHTGVMRYGCKDCDQRFTCITNLQAHRRVYHRSRVASTGQLKKSHETNEMLIG
ncbi:zinc finger protein 845-like [Anopheles marshallii]|uniref:zinc finger protein 845-like n=1 Tax=Anopheles marshallii TaxID=1521116 RepID=UPI00237B762B|nr:zinc finger protein 845-like [Anopheles marshallii]